MSLFDWQHDDPTTLPPSILRELTRAELARRPWWEHPRSIRIRPARARGGWSMTPPGRLDVSGSNPYVVEFRGHDVTSGFIVPEALRASLAEILEHERTGRPWAIRYDPPRRSWARRTAARLAALLERFAG